MDIKEYISSGIIESYVLGLASEPEVRELKLLAEVHPEIREAINLYEAGLADLALQNPVPPPSGLKERIWESIKEDRPGDNVPAGRQAKENKSGSLRMLKYWIAAACTGLLLSVGLNIAYRIRINRQSNALARAAQTNQELSDEQSILRAVTAPSIKTVVLQGIPAHQGTRATVYWDSTSKAVYLALNQLPKPAAGKQYQLWALVNGKPLDAGLYDPGNPLPVQKLKNIASADMFAITLEPRGGSVSPTLSQMYVAGKL